MPHTKRTKEDLPPPPKVGGDIYVDTSLYIDHGEDDFCGGLCEVSSVKWEERVNGGDFSISIRERPGHGYYWSFLSREQEELAKEFEGKGRGYEDPDPVEIVKLNDREAITLNAVRCVLARCPQELREKLQEAGIDIYKAEHADAVRLMNSDFITLLLGIHKGFDGCAEQILKRKSQC